MDEFRLHASSCLLSSCLEGDAPRKEELVFVAAQSSPPTRVWAFPLGFILVILALLLIEIPSPIKTPTSQSQGVELDPPCMVTEVEHNELEMIDESEMYVRNGHALEELGE
ncbi:hypothetical protein V6N13_109807 [Hibiscus sabdariffa]